MSTKDETQGRLIDSFASEWDLKRLCKEGHVKEALSIFDKIQSHLDFDSCVYVLQGCISIKAFNEGRKLHARLIRNISHSNVFLANLLITMYCKISSIDDALKVFENMPIRNVFTWTLLIAGYERHGNSYEAIKLYFGMKHETIKPDNAMFVTVLRACTSVSSHHNGKQVHADILKAGCASDKFVGSALVDMYSKSGRIFDARWIFLSMPSWDIVSWNGIIAGYAHHGDGEQIFKIFKQMKQEGMKPNRATFLSILAVCSANGQYLEHGKQLYNEIQEAGYESDVIVGSKLVDIYAKSGSTSQARTVFDAMHARDSVVWNTIIAAYSREGDYKESFNLFQRMKEEGIEPDISTFISVLAGDVPALELGKQIHAVMLQCGQISNILSISNTLVDMYAKCGNLLDAHRVFNGICGRDVVSWSALISGYICNGDGRAALNIFQKMHLEGLNPDKVSLNSILCACADLGCFGQGKIVHASIIKSGWDSDCFVANTIVDMYTKCQCISYACEVFDLILTRNVVSWSTIISGYALSGDVNVIVKLFRCLHEEGVKADKVTFSTMLSACATLSCLELGKQAHASVLVTGCEMEVFVCSTLVDMYVKCGCLEDGCQILDRMLLRNTVTWDALVSGYAQYGDLDKALRVFRHMQKEGMKATSFTFSALLCGCSHACLADDGCFLFHLMREAHNITPSIQHYASVVDLFGRAGYLHEAVELIDAMPFESNAMIWTSFLSACATYNHLELAEYTIPYIAELEPWNPGPFVTLSNMYAVVGRWDDAVRMTRTWEFMEPICKG